jgi:hypothetical protein
MIKIDKSFHKKGLNLGLKVKAPYSPWKESPLVNGPLRLDKNGFQESTQDGPYRHKYSSIINKSPLLSLLCLFAMFFNKYSLLTF